MALVKSNSAAAATIVTTLAVSFTSGSAAAGNVLVSFLAVDKSAGTAPTISEAGWTVAHSLVSADVSVAAAYKVAAGGETTVTWNWTTGEECGAWLGEDDGDAFDASNNANSGATAVASQVTGSVTPAAAGTAYGAVGVDTGFNWGTANWTTLTKITDINAAAGAGAPGLYVASAAASSGVAIEGTAARGSGATDDQAAGVLLVVSDTAGDPPQIARPSADASVGGWVTDTGASTNLFEAIDEVTPSDADYIRSPTDPTNAPCVVDLGALTDPASSTDHIIRYRYLKSGTATIDLTVELREGYVSEAAQGTLIASWPHTNISTTAATAEQTLTGPQADAITDYTDLSLRFIANQT